MKKFLSLTACLVFCFAVSAYAQDEDQNEAQQKAISSAVKRLGNTEPLIRQRAAEELARYADNNQKLIVDGYRVQEKDRRVRLALDWALYRMGNENKLFDIAYELGTSRRNQASSYLVQLEKPEMLYGFLRSEDKVLIGLLGVLAQIGNEGTLVKLEPYTRVVNQEIVSAAKYAREEIYKRLANPALKKQTRPRTVGETSQP